MPAEALGRSVSGAALLSGILDRVAEYVLSLASFFFLKVTHGKSLESGGTLVSFV